MKTVKYLQIVMLVALLLVVISGYVGWKSCFGMSVFVVGITLVFSIYYTIRQEKIMAYLVKEIHEKDKEVLWDENDIERLENLRKKSDLSVLQYQINPHFLYNTLDSIRSLALLHSQKDIAIMTEKLSRFFRYAISIRENLVRIEEETRHIQDYYYIQKQRFGDRFDMELVVEEDSLLQCYMPKLLLQPLVENAIVHGLEKTKEGGIVKIAIFRSNQNIIINITDNGSGMPEETLIALNERLGNQIRVPTRHGRNNGIAIQNVNARICLTFGEYYGIHYRSMEGQGTTALVTIPYVDQLRRAQYEEILNQEQR